MMIFKTVKKDSFIQEFLFHLKFLRTRQWRLAPLFRLRSKAQSEGKDLVSWQPILDHQSKDRKPRPKWGNNEGNKKMPLLKENKTKNSKQIKTFRNGGHSSSSSSSACSSPRASSISSLEKNVEVENLESKKTEAVLASQNRTEPSCITQTKIRNPTSQNVMFKILHVLLKAASW